MSEKEQENRFRKLLENAPLSPWKEEFEYRRDNKYWLDIAFSVAVIILREIRQKKIKRKFRIYKRTYDFQKY